MAFRYYEVYFVQSRGKSGQNNQKNSYRTIPGTENRIKNHSKRKVFPNVSRWVPLIDNRLPTILTKKCWCGAARFAKHIYTAIERFALIFLFVRSKTFEVVYVCRLFDQHCCKDNVCFTYFVILWREWINPNKFFATALSLKQKKKAFLSLMLFAFCFLCCRRLITF